MTDRDFERCRECTKLLGVLDDAVGACKRCGTPYNEMPEKEDREIFQ